MNNRKYGKEYILIRNIWLFLLAGLLGYTVACFIYINFGTHRTFSWSSYWRIARYVIAAIIGLQIGKWLTKTIPFRQK
jgi:hypothetical protein